MTFDENAILTLLFLGELINVTRWPNDYLFQYYSKNLRVLFSDNRTKSYHFGWQILKGVKSSDSKFKNPIA